MAGVIGESPNPCCISTHFMLVVLGIFPTHPASCFPRAEFTLNPTEMSPKDENKQLQVIMLVLEKQRESV